MKKIAIISTTFPPLSGGGGVASAHYNLYRQLRDNGYEVKVFTFNDDDTASDKKPSLSGDVIRFGLSSSELVRFNRNNIIRRKIDKWILRKQGDDQLKYQYQLVQKANIAAKKINPFLCKYNPQIVFLPSNGATGNQIVKISGARYFHICHHNPMQMIGNPLMTEHSLLDAKQAIAVEQESLSKIDVVICVSNYIKKLFIQTHTFDKQIVMLPNIVDDVYIANITKKDLHKLLAIDLTFPIIYIPSAGIKSKGEQFVIEIMRRISHSLSNNVGFYVSGTLSKAQQYELSFLKGLNIYVSGDITNDENISFVKDCQLCVSPTHTENYSMALVEALFTEIPCVVFDVGGNGDIVIDDKTGYIVPYCDMEALIDKSLSILNSQQLQKDLKGSIRLFNEERSASKIIEQYIALF